MTIKFKLLVLHNNLGDAKIWDELSFNNLVFVMLINV